MYDVATGAHLDFVAGHCAKKKRTNDSDEKRHSWKDREIGEEGDRDEERWRSGKMEQWMEDWGDEGLGRGKSREIEEWGRRRCSEMTNVLAESER